MRYTTKLIIETIFAILLELFVIMFTMILISENFVWWGIAYMFFVGFLGINAICGNLKEIYY